MLHTMHQMGVQVKVEPTWTREEWCNAIVHQFNIHCMPPAWETATETAQICCKLKRGGEWKRAWKPQPNYSRV